jgi:hypothetical protein
MGEVGQGAGCPVCARLEAELLLQERHHAQALGRLAYHVVRGEHPGLAQMRMEESDARMEATLAQELLAAHRRKHAELDRRRGVSLEKLMDSPVAPFRM